MAALFWVRRKSIFATGQLKTNIPSEGDTFESLLPSRLLPTLVQSGQVKDYRELARLAQVSTARVAQIVVLAQLAPRIQEYVLFLSAEHAGLITELQLREIAREPRWDRQLTQFERLLGSRR